MKRKGKAFGKRALALLLSVAMAFSAVVSAVAASQAENAAGPVFQLQETLSLPLSGGGYPSYPEVVQAVKNQTSLTVTAQFMQTATGIGSIFSASNGSADAQHFHVYVNGTTLGYEMRGANGTDEKLDGAVPALRSSGVNTVAFVADSSAHTF